FLPQPVRANRDAASTTNPCPADRKPSRERALRLTPPQSATIAHGRRSHPLRRSDEVGRQPRVSRRVERPRRGRYCPPRLLLHARFGGRCLILVPMRSGPHDQVVCHIAFELGTPLV